MISNPALCYPGHRYKVYDSSRRHASLPVQSSGDKQRICGRSFLQRVSTTTSWKARRCPSSKCGGRGIRLECLRKARTAASSSKPDGKTRRHTRWSGLGLQCETTVIWVLTRQKCKSLIKGCTLRIPPHSLVAGVWPSCRLPFLYAKTV